jgi:prepilin-type N-terminal cleavage/methylation domain-containing protein
MRFRITNVTAKENDEIYLTHVKHRTNHRSHFSRQHTMNKTNNTSTKAHGLAKTKKRGFSLVEIMIAVGIVGLFAGLVGFIVLGVMPKGRLNAGRTNAVECTKYIANVQAVGEPGTAKDTVLAASTMAAFLTAAQTGVPGPTGLLKLSLPSAPTAANYTITTGDRVSFNGSDTSDLQP